MSSRLRDSRPQGVTGSDVVGKPQRLASLALHRLEYGRMVPLLKRQAVRLLRQEGRTQADVARLTGVSRRQVRRIDIEPPIASLSDTEERKRRGIGRPSKTEGFTDLIVSELRAEPSRPSADIFRRAILAGYSGSRSAMYAFVARLRKRMGRPLAR